MATDRIPAEEKIIWAHYFSAGGDWYVAELGEPGDDASTEAFGYMKLAAFPDGAEWGYFGLEGLEQVKAMGGLVIVERDCWWKPCRFSDIREVNG
jgi:hypothetical protein